MQQKVCARDVPAAEDGMLRTDLLEIHVVVGVELRRVLADAHRARGFGAGYFFQVGRRGERAAVAGREDVEIAVVGGPDRLVVLRTVTAAGESDFVGRDDHGLLGERRTAVNGDPGAVGILRRRNRSGGVGAAGRAAVGFGDQFRVGHHVRPLPDAVAAHAHRHDRGVELPVRLFQSGKGHFLAVAEEVFRVDSPFGLPAGVLVEVVEQQRLRDVAVGVRSLRVAGRDGHHLVAPRAVGGDAVEFVEVAFGGFARSIQVVGCARARAALVIDQREDVILVLEYPVGAAEHLRTRAAHGGRALVERRSGDQVARAVVLRRNDVGGFGVGVRCRLGVVVVVAARGRHAGGAGAQKGKECPGVKAFFHDSIFYFSVYKSVAEMNAQLDVERAARFLEAEIVVKPCVGQVTALQSEVVASVFDAVGQREVVRQLVGHVGF